MLCLAFLIIAKCNFTKREMRNSNNSQNDEEIEIQAIKRDSRETFPLLMHS